MTDLALMPMVGFAYAFSLLACMGACIMIKDRSIPVIAFFLYLVMAVAPAVIVTAAVLQNGGIKLG